MIIPKASRLRLLVAGSVATAGLELQAQVPQAASDTAAPPVLWTSIAAAVHFQGFTFARGSDAAGAHLFLYPVAVQQRITSTTAIDAYAAYAVGSAQVGPSTYRLTGPVDSWARLRWAFRPWAVFAAGFSLPTGVERHTAEQATVSTVLSNDLLGFREGAWGSGPSTTVGVSSVREIGPWRTTAGVSYRLAEDFSPRRDTTVRYAPGNEARMRVAAEREVGPGYLEGGFTFQTFSIDRLDRKNLFQPGIRLRGDATYTVGRSSYQFANLWRARGELTAPVVNILDDSFVRDTLLPVPWQNLTMLGVTHIIPVNPRFAILPSAQLKVRTRESRVGRGWLASLGVSTPLQRIGLEFFPSARVNRGAVVGATDSSRAHAVWGAELSLVVRRGAVRRVRVPQPDVLGPPIRPFDLISLPPMVQASAPVPPPLPAPQAASVFPVNEREIIRDILERAIFFDVDRADLHPTARETLDDKVELMRADSTIRMVVIGRTDPRGPASYNRRLGSRRAEAAKQYLVANGIAAERIEIRQELTRLEDCADQACWQQARRVDFLLDDSADASGSSSAGGPGRSDD